MQPLTAAMPFKPEGAPLLGGCWSAVWTWEALNRLCVPLFSLSEITRSWGRGGAEHRRSRSCWEPSWFQSSFFVSASQQLTEGWRSSVQQHPNR